MFTRIRQFLAPPVFEGDEEKTFAASVLNPLLISMLVVLVLAAIATPFLFAQQLGSWITLAIFILLLVFSKFLMQSGRVRPASLLFVFGLWIACTAMILLSGGVYSSFMAFYIVVATMAGLLLGRNMAVFVAIAGSLVGLGAVILDSTGNLPPLLFPQPAASRWVMLTIGLILVITPLNLALRLLGEALGRSRRYASELEQQREYLEETVEERTRNLVQRARYLEATAEVARDASSVLDLDELLTRVVQLVSQRFAFYHTGIFLLDAAREWAVLQAASSEGGQRMLARSHRLKVGEVGIVGYVAGRNEARVALDVGADAVFFDNPDLPETRSEMALPLRARGQLIGVLDVQSREPGAFSEEDVTALQTLADQVAVAISNAWLFRQAEESAEAERRAYGELSREAWQQLLRTEPELGYLRNRQGLVPAGDLWRTEMESAVQTGRITPGGDGEASAALAVPIKLGGRVIGVIDVRKPEQAGEWASEEVALVEVLTEQLSLALESARLYRDSQQAAARDRLLAEITGRVRESLDVRTVLETAANELYEQLDLDKVAIRLMPKDDDSRSTL